MNKVKGFFGNIFPSKPGIGEIGSIKLNLWLANITGVPLISFENESRIFALFSVCYGICILATVTLFYTIFEINDLLQNLNDLDRFTENICLSFTHASGVLKIINIFYRRKDVKDLLAKLKHVTKTYTKSDKQIETFQYGELQNKIVLSIYMGLVFFTGLMAVFMLFINPDEIAGKTFPYRVALPVWMPLLVQHVYMAVSVIILALQIVSVDYLNVNIINQIRFQLIILNLSFEKLIVNITSNRDNKRLTINASKSLQRLSSIIEHHCLLREIRQKTEEIFRYPVLLQFFTSLMIFAMTGFQATVKTDSGNMDILIYFYCSCIFCQLFVYCWFGNEVFEQSKTLATSGFNSSWYLFDHRFGRSLLIFLTNAQIPFQFTAGGFMGLSLPSFAGILSKSYSYIALLRQFYAR